MGDATVTAIVAAAGFFLNVVVLAVTGAWQLNRHRDALISSITRNRLDSEQVIAELRREMDQEFAIVRRETGETTTALRTKLTDVELWGRDNFVRRDSFYKIFEQMQENYRLSNDKIEGKIDKLAQRFEELRDMIVPVKRP